MLIYRLVRPAPLKAVIQAPTEPVKLYYHEARTESSAFSSKVSLLSFFTVYLPQSGRFDSCITTVYTLCRAFFHLKFTNCIGLFFRFRFLAVFYFYTHSFSCITRFPKQCCMPYISPVNSLRIHLRIFRSLREICTCVVFRTRAVSLWVLPPKKRSLIKRRS